MEFRVSKALPQKYKNMISIRNQTYPTLFFRIENNRYVYYYLV